MSDQPTEQTGEQTGEQPEDQPADPTGEQPAEPEHAAGAAGSPEDGTTEDVAQVALATLDGQGRPQPPRPPKRTGVFLDPDDLRTHVGDLLRAMLGGYEVDPYGNYTFTHEDARVFVTVGATPIGPQVGVLSITNVDVELTPPLAGFLLTTNHQLGFGSFSYDADSRAVWLRHTLLGTTLDGPELQAALMAVASTAAHFDDVIEQRFGGRPFVDADEDTQKQTRPPDPAEQQQYPDSVGYL
ncbi:MAG: T3SS (YopN, CesT) and YbjN peptide-binding chaperone 1 [Actinomycetes bacterium]